MKAFRHFLLLATFAAMGLGLAVWVAISTDCTGINGTSSSNLSVYVAVPHDLPGASTLHESIRRAKSSASTVSTRLGEAPKAVRGESAVVRPDQVGAVRFAASEFLAVPAEISKSQVTGPELIAPQPPMLIALANNQPESSQYASVSSSRELTELTRPIGARSRAVPSAPGAANGPVISNWMLDDLKRDGPLPPVAAPSHSFDPGQPGTNRDLARPSTLP